MKKFKKFLCVTLSCMLLFSTVNVFADSGNKWAPPGLTKKAKIPNGLKKKFDAFQKQSWNKEELKALFEMLKDLFDDYDNDEDEDKTKTPANKYIGTFVEIKNDDLKIKINNETKTFDMDDDIKVVFNNKEGKLTDINKNDLLEIQIDKDGDVSYIRVLRDLRQAEYTGTVKYLEKNDDLLVLNVNNKYTAFKLNSKVSVRFNKTNGSLSDIKKGDTITIELDNNEEVIIIHVGRTTAYKTYVGTIVNSYTNGVFKIKEDNDTVRSFKVVSNFAVQFKDKIGTVLDIKLGDPVEIKVDRDSNVVNIQANRKFDSNIIEGKLVQIYEDTKNRDNNYLVVEVNDSLFVYYLNRAIDVYVNNVEKDLKDLRKDDQVRLGIESSKVTVIKAYR